MAAIGQIRASATGSSATRFAPGAERDFTDQPGAATPGTGPLDRLLNQISPLDRLVGDAGALGRFRTDMPDHMPSGTSALTLKIGDALNRLAARLGIPGERILAGNPAQLPEAPQRAPAELPPGDRADPAASITAPRPEIAIDAGNHARHADRGNRIPGGA